MAHYQERRTGGERRQLRNRDRRKNTDRRSSHAGTDLEFIERARFKAWLVMTDRDT